VTQIYIKPSSNQRSTTSREASAAGRLRPNGVLRHWDFRLGPVYKKETSRELNLSPLRNSYRLFTIRLSVSEALLALRV